MEKLSDALSERATKCEKLEVVVNEMGGAITRREKKTDELQAGSTCVLCELYGPVTCGRMSARA